MNNRMGESALIKLRAEKDFWAGFLYVLLAAAFLWFGRDLKVGAAARMGPGYFPLTLGWILGAFGVVSIARSFLSDGPPVGNVAWKKLAIITAAVLVFGFLVDTAGLLFALPALVILSALASEQSVYDFKGLLVLIGLTVFCIIVFVKALGVPMPILGSWFEGLAPLSWLR
ncbi:tripartite tricarboxylate transporter TctB family protein [Bradyrhizobium sp. LB11.1]|uniref:tripartite tricarboxylate transporter TctB family protein n=1 Tax=Bradyrhizobium sp. LB11.1 TaxID=3156326 RepID=UPI0033919379